MPRAAFSGQRRFYNNLTRNKSLYLATVGLTQIKRYLLSQLRIRLKERLI
jgi:hypothetical protein